MDNRIRLDILTTADTKAVTAILLDDSVKKTYMVPDLTPDGAEKMASRIIALSADDSRYVRGIYRDKVLVGFLNDVGMERDSIELGWVVHPEHQNKGYATAGVKAAIAELLSMHYAQVEAGAFVENPASIRVMEKAGMEKTDKTETIDYRGKMHTCVFYARRK